MPGDLSLNVDRQDSDLKTCNTSSAVSVEATSQSPTLTSDRRNPDSFSEEKCTAPGLSTFRLLMAHIGAALTLFLATTDATIISTMLPSVASDLEADSTQYTWVGVAYLLTQTAFQPLYGRISDIVGRKNLLYASITIFAVGSLLCGVAQNIQMLIASRALAGIGGGGIVSCVWVITSEIVEVRHRAKWSQALSVTWSCSAVAGPLLGGAFSGSSFSSSSALNWRWGFYLNLPLCLVGFVVLLISLPGVCLHKASDVTWRSLLRRFDFGGLFFFMGGTTGIILGFSFATSIGWSAPSTIILVSLGILVLGCGGLYEVKTSRESLFPPTMFKNRNAVVILAIVFLHNFAFNAGTFYLALFYQGADGLNPLEAGIQMLPYSLGSSLASMPAAWLIGYLQKRTRNTTGQNWVISAGLLICTLGFGLLNLLNEKSSMLVQIMFPLIAGIGLGFLFHAPYQVFAKALKPSELATGTSAFFLVRFTGATIGISVAGTIFDARLASLVPDSLATDFDSSTINFKQVTSGETELLHSISMSIQTVWTVCAPLLGIAFLLSLLLKKLPIEEDPTIELENEKRPIESSSNTV